MANNKILGMHPAAFIGILLLGYLFFVAPSNNPFAFIGGQTVAQGEAVSVNTYGSCGDDNLATLSVVGESTVKTVTGATTNPVITAAGVTSGAMLFTNGQNNLIVPWQTASLAATYTAFGVQVECGEDISYYIIAGNDTAAATKAVQGYYLTETDPFTVSGQMNVDVDLVPQGNVTLMGKREGGAITVYYNATNVYTGTLAASTTYNDFYVKLSETRRGDFIKPHIAFGATAGDTSTMATEWTTFRPRDSTQAAVPSRLSGTYNTAYALNVDKIAANTELELPLDVTTTVGYTGGNSNPALIAYDMGTYVDRGHIVEAAENLANVNIGGEDSSVLTFNSA